MLSSTTTGFSVSLTPRPVRVEKDIQAIENFILGKELSPTRRHRRAIKSLSVALAGIEAYALLPIGVAMAQSKDSVIPKEVDDILMRIELICLGTCVSVAIIFAMIAGFFRIIGLREEARKRYGDAVMGMLQVLSAPAVLGVLALVVRGVLKMFPGYVG